MLTVSTVSAAPRASEPVPGPIPSSHFSLILHFRTLEILAPFPNPPLPHARNSGAELLRAVLAAVAGPVRRAGPHTGRARAAQGQDPVARGRAITAAAADPAGACAVCREAHHEGFGRVALYFVQDWGACVRREMGQVQPRIHLCARGRALSSFTFRPVCSSIDQLSAGQSYLQCFPQPNS